jgi:hypothetical protein
MAVLGNAAFGNIKVRDHLNPNHDVVVKPSRKLCGLPQCTVDTAANSRGPAARLNVDVAGAESGSLLENRSLNPDDRREVYRRSGLARSRPLNQRGEL